MNKKLRFLLAAVFITAASPAGAAGAPDEAARYLASLQKQCEKAGGRWTTEETADEYIHKCLPPSRTARASQPAPAPAPPAPPLGILARLNQAAEEAALSGKVYIVMK